MNMDVWYDFLVRELTDVDRAMELRLDAEQLLIPERFPLRDEAEDDAPTPR